MHIILLLAAIHALIFAFAFLLVGYTTLIGADAQEIAASKEQFERARQQGWWAQWEAIGKYRRDFMSVPRLASHWADRPDARKFIYLGAAFLAVAALLGIPLGAYK
jgi:hypothetical protein